MHQVCPISVRLVFSCWWSRGLFLSSSSLARVSTTYTDQDGYSCPFEKEPDHSWMVLVVVTGDHPWRICVFQPTTNEKHPRICRQTLIPGIAKLASQTYTGYVGYAASLSKVWILTCLIEQNWQSSTVYELARKRKSKTQLIRSAESWRCPWSTEMLVRYSLIQKALGRLFGLQLRKHIKRRVCIKWPSRYKKKAFP